MPTGVKLFVSAPISSFSDVAESARFGASLDALLVGLRSRLPAHSVYCAVETVKRRGYFDTPVSATTTDLDALQASTHLLFLYPTRVPTSALIELGYAIALRMPVVAVTGTRASLPFMAQAFDEILPNFVLLELDLLNAESHPQIIECVANLVYV
jgi:hypothetical protein